MKKSITTIIFSLLFTFSFAQNLKVLKTVEETAKLSEEVAKLFKDQKHAEAFDLLSTYWPLPQNEIDGLEQQTLKYMNILSERFGKIQKYVKVKSENIQNVTTQEVYFICYDKSAIRLIFTYYKTEAGWILNRFKWDDSFTDEFNSGKTHD